MLVYLTITLQATDFFCYVSVNRLMLVERGFISLSDDKLIKKCPRLCGLLVSYGNNSLASLRATSLFVLMHSLIVNEYQLLCDARTVLELHKGTAAFSFLLTVVLFHFFFICVCHS